MYFRQKDVFSYIKSFDGEAYDVIFVDPPFTQSLAHEVMVALTGSKLASPGAQVVIESSRQEKIEDNYEGYILLDRKDFGDKYVSFFEKDAY